MNTTVIAITGPSGFNKSDLVKVALQQNPNFIQVVSYTDRPRKHDEEDGREFKFITEDEFTRMVESERFLEWQRLLSNNHRYGKTKEDFSNIIESNQGKVIFTSINIINLPLLKRYYPNLKSIFIDVKDTTSLIEYLKNSPDVTDNEEFEKRLKFATEERRRRHLADITIHMHENFDESFKDFMDSVNKLSS